MQKGKMESFSIYSHLLEETVEVLVYLPPFYSPTQPYPYIIAQDGKDFFQMGRVARTLDELIQQQKVQPILFFGVPYKNVSDRRQKYHPSGSKNELYIRFLPDELIPVIDRNYSVSDLGSERALAGDSLAATVSFMTSLEYPYTFQKLMLFSPYVNETLLQKAQDFSNWQALEIYHTIGKEETVVKMTDGRISDFLTENRKLSKLIQQGDSTYRYNEFNGNHTWKFWQQEFKHAVTALFPKY